MEQQNLTDMPLCEGRSDGPGQFVECPDRRNDGTVKNRQGDLFLCDACDKYRFPPATVTTKPGPSSTGVAGIASKSRITTPKECPASGVPVVVNEVLTYVNVYRDRASVDNLRKVLTGFFTAPEINTAKKLLVGTFTVDLAECSLKAERRKSTSRGINEAEAEDIIGIFDYLDQRSKLPKATFAAANLERLPKYGPEEINICSIADKQSELGHSVASLASRVDEMAVHQPSSQLSALADFKTDLTNTVHQELDSLQAKITNLTNVCSQLADGVNSQRSVPTTGSTTASSSTSSASSGNVDRSRNIIIFGVDDTRDRNLWRDTVSDALRTAAGRDVFIEDALRIGSPTPCKKRPVLIKLQSVWDRRAVLGGSWKLSSTAGFEQVYIAPDEPREARRRRTMDRLVKKATSQGKQVSVANGILSVDDVEVFSLELGFIKRRDGQA